MKLTDITKSVRLCIDEEAVNDANFTNASDGDCTRMDAIITDKIGDALRWVCLYAPASLLTGSDEKVNDEPVDTGIVKDIEPTARIIDPSRLMAAGIVNLPADFVKLVRVRVNGWHRAIRVPLEEDAEEYLHLYDEHGASATAERPVAALIEKASKQLELWPCGSVKPKAGEDGVYELTNASVELTYIASVEASELLQGSGDSKFLPLPPKSTTSFIYYLAFLLLSAYGDERAARMLEIAKMNLGVTQQ